jgi:hypothetical protein
MNNGLKPKCIIDREILNKLLSKYPFCDDVSEATDKAIATDLSGLMIVRPIDLGLKSSGVIVDTIKTPICTECGEDRPRLFTDDPANEFYGRNICKLCEDYVD